MIVDARACIEAELAHERRFVSPDFAAVVTAAHDRNPELVSEEALREVGGLAPVIELEFCASDADESGAASELDAWIQDTRELTEADVAARRLAGIPPLPAGAPPVRRELSWLGLAVALVAVVAGLAVAIPRLLETFVDGSYREAQTTPSQAEYREHEVDSPAGANRHPALGPVAPVPTLAPILTPTPQRAVSHQVEEVEEVEQVEPHRQATATNKTETSLRERVGELEAQAQAHWAAGELEQAQANYAKIIALAGRRRYADLAYGDLFTLARQRGDAAAELTLWREYLVTFPNGRFADDARAGQCRRASADERDACWRGYLADFPKGVHSSVAARALAPEIP
jgi:hypothetical protein